MDTAGAVSPERDPVTVVTVHAMGMPFRVVLAAEALDAPARAAVEAFHAGLRWADEVFSLWREDSVLAAYLRGEIAVDEGPPELLEVLQACEWYRGATGGAFDARGPRGLDPTGLVKGWAVARASGVLDSLGVPWLVDAAGDVLVAAGERTWSVGVAHPGVQGDPAGTDVVDVVTLGDAGPRALATSGIGQRGAHIWDPATGEATTHAIQASVVGHDLVTADVWATAVMAGGDAAVAGAVAAGCDVLVLRAVRPNGTVEAAASAGWPGER